VRCNVCVVLADLFASGEPIEPKVKADAVRYLTPLLRDQQAILRYRAVVALGSAGPDARAAIEQILFMLRDNATWESREAAATALGLIAHDPVNGPSLEVLKYLYALLNDRAYKVRMAAVHSLSLLGPSNANDKELVDNYVAALLPIAQKDPELSLQIWARVAIIGATKDFKAAYINPIAKHTESSDPVVRLQAVQALGTLGTNAKSTVPVLINSLADPDASVQMAAIWAVGRMESSAINALPLLNTIMEIPNIPDYVKNAAKESAEKIKGK
jgi:HEAT repeat protein